MATVTGQPPPRRDVGSSGESDRWAAEPLAQRVPLAVALSRHPIWVVIPAVVLFVAGFVGGLNRAPTYTAQSSLIIGTSDPASPNFSGNVAAAGSLATAYSRAIIATPVVDSVSATLHLSRNAVIANLSSAPVPDSPEFDLTATGKSSTAAIDLANASSAAVIRYLGSINSGSLNQSSLLSSYQAAESKLNKENAAVVKAENPPPGVPINQTVVNALKAQRAEDQLVASGLSTDYDSALAANPPATGIAPLTNAFSTTNDRKSTAELYGFIGLVAGGLLGVALAAFLGAREVRRSPLRG